MSTTKRTIFERLISFQADLKLVTKDANNPFFKSKYATLDSIQLAIQPLLAKHGLGYTQSVTTDGLQTTLYSVDGETIDGGLYPVNVSGKPQEVGSAVTYARRYALTSFLGIIVGDEDDDGNEANKVTKPVFDGTVLEMFKQGLLNAGNIEECKGVGKTYRSKYSIDKVMAEKLMAEYNKRINQLNS